MTLTEQLQKQYTEEQYSAQEAQLLAHLISWGPVVFQVARLLNKYGILQLLDEHNEGVTIQQIEQETGLSSYAVKCLMEAALTMHAVLIDDKNDVYTLAKTGWFLLNDPLVRVDIDFNQDVNYEGWFLLDEALETGKPVGLRHFGDWKTIYEGLSSLPEQVQKSWFGFDHYYSDHSFGEALKIIFRNEVNNLLDVGGNTGKFARKVVEYDKNVNVTVCDLPQQLEMMRKQTAGHPAEGRVHAQPINLLDNNMAFPNDKHYDVIWMSQLLECFGEE